nr:MAG TPA: hypothetical protein [Crassvirales sp.]
MVIKRTIRSMRNLSNRSNRSFILIQRNLSLKKPRQNLL